MSSDTPWGTYAAVGLLLFAVYRCNSKSGDEQAAEVVAARTYDEDAARERAEEAARMAVSGTTYEDQGQPYGCTEDCSGHDAGYKWAEENEITDTGDCGGNSQSFVEGCQAYAEAYENQERGLGGSGGVKVTPARRSTDHREPLKISQDTWDREPAPAQLTRLATAIGRRLIVVRRNGEEWEPEGEDPSHW